MVSEDTLTHDSSNTIAPEDVIRIPELGVRRCAAVCACETAIRVAAALARVALVCRRSNDIEIADNPQAKPASVHMLDVHCCPQRLCCIRVICRCYSCTAQRVHVLPSKMAPCGRSPLRVACHVAACQNSHTPPMR